MTHLLFLRGNVCADINVMGNVVVVDGAMGVVGAVGAETVVVALLARIFA